MRSLVMLLVLSLFSSVLASAQPLDGRTMVLKAADHASRNVPVSLPYDGPVPEGVAVVVEPKTGKEFSVTIGEGLFTFIPESVMPGAENMYTVKVTGEPRAPHVRIEKQEDKDALDVFIYGKLFTTYHYANEPTNGDAGRKPYLWPVYAEGGVAVTRAWPMGEAEKSDDHPHQKSLWTAYGDVNGVDLWAEGDNAGHQHSDEVTWGSGDAYGWIRARNTWQDAERTPIMSEEREYRFYAMPEDARLIDVRVVFAPIDKDVKFGDTKEGGVVAVRVRDEMRADAAGAIANAEGLKGEKGCWGRPSPWCDYSGAVEGAGVRGIAVFDHPENLRHPSRWHVRDYGLMAANCFGLSYFTKGEKERLNGDFTLTKGHRLTFNYRILVHSGDVEGGKVAERYADYAQAPEVVWAEPAAGEPSSDQS